MSRKKANWEAFKEKNSQKRRRKAEKDPLDFITVQRLSAKVEGKCQKYSRIGPLAILPYHNEHLDIESIKEACTKHFNVPGMECDVLAGERGPSFSSIDQLKNLKVIHVRFVRANQEDEEDDLDLLAPAFSCSTPPMPRRRTTIKKQPIERELVVDQSDSFIPNRGEDSFIPNRGEDSFIPNRAKSCTDASIHDSQKEQETNRPKKKYPDSVPISQLLQLGKFIPPSREVIEIELEEFDVEKREWLAPFQAKLSVCKNSFASGGFRNAFLVDALSGLKGPPQYVLKRCKPEGIQIILDNFGSVENHTRKSVQMHSLARYFAITMEKLCLNNDNYGEHLKYSKVYYGKLKGESVTVELYIPGTFIKYINNNGEILVQDGEIAAKVEAFAHFTYVKSERALVVLDIQGTGYSLYDPEIASTDLLDESKSSIQFCAGNLSVQAIDHFLEKHRCNKYCAMLTLSQLYTK
eukprot:gene13471-14862_t